MVDRARFGYSLPVKSITMANRIARITQSRAVPKLMANRNGLEMRLQPHPSPDQNRMEVRHG